MVQYLWCSLSAMRMPLLCKKAWDGWTPWVKWWDRSLHKSHRVHSTRHPIRSDLHWPSPNWCLSYGVALLKCGLRFSISGRSVVSSNYLDREVKGHGNFEHLGKGFCEIWYRWSILYPSSPWRGETAASRDSNCGRVPRIIQSSNGQHSKISVTCVTFTLSFWKGFDSRIRMQGSCLVQCSGVHQQVLADQWSVQTIWIARWKGMESLNTGRDLSEESSAPGKWYLWDMISINQWSIMYPSSPWRGETAASRDDNFRGVPRFIQSSNVQHSQISITCVTFTHPERVLILGSGCKGIALYNVQGSISRSWQISGQCKQSGSRGERAWKFWKEAGIFRKSLQKLTKGICEIWYQFCDDESIIYFVSIITLTWRVPCIIQSSNVQHSQISVTFVTFTHPERILILGSGCKDIALYNVQYNAQGSISWSVPTIWIARWKGIEILKRGQHLSEESSTPGKGFLWDMISMIYYVIIHHHLDVARQLHQEMAIFDEYLVSSRVRMCNTLKFPSLASPSLILKGFWFWDQDARILPCTMFRGPSAGPGTSVVSANNLDREVKGFEKRPGSFGRVFNRWKGMWDMLSINLMNRWSIT